MNREELIEEAAKAMSQGYVQDGRISSFFELAEVAFAVFEKAQAPTDEERGVSAQDVPEATHVSSTNFRRPAQTEPTEPTEYEYLLMAGSLIIGGTKSLNEAISADEIPENGNRVATYRRAKGDKKWTLVSHWEGTCSDVGHEGRPAHAEPTDAQVIAVLNALNDYEPPITDPSYWSVVWRDKVRAALKAAFTAGQEQREALAEAWDEGYIQRMYDYPADEDERINPYRIVTAGQEEQS